MAHGSIHKYEGKRGVRWRIRLEYTDPATGRRCQPWETLKAGSTERDAQKRLRAWLAEVEAGATTLPAKRTVEALCVEWLDKEARYKYEPTTVEKYEATIRRHILPELGALLLKRLTPERIRTYRAGKLEAGTGTRTMQLAMLRLGQVLAYAVDSGYLAKSPAKGIGAVRHRGAERTAWTGKQSRIFLRAAQRSTYHPLWHVALATGLRRGELLGLRWRDLDMEGGSLTVRQSVVLLGGCTHIKQPKNDGAGRSLRLDTDTVALLAAHRAEQLARRLRLGTAWEDHDLVFASTRGTPINPNNATRELHRLIARAGVPKLGMHSLRHSAVVLMQEAALPLKTISERLGHASIRVTGDIYAHFTQDMQTDAAARIEGMLRIVDGPENEISGASAVESL